MMIVACKYDFSQFLIGGWASRWIRVAGISYLDQQGG